MKPDLNNLPTLFPPKQIPPEELNFGGLDGHEYEEDFGGRDWTQISDETYRKHFLGFSQMDPKLLIHYIAGFIRFIYRNRNDGSSTEEYFTFFVEGKYFQRFCTMLSNQQVLFLVEVIDYLYLTDGSPSIDYCWDQNRIIVLKQAGLSG